MWEQAEIRWCSLDKQKCSFLDSFFAAGTALKLLAVCPVSRLALEFWLLNWATWQQCRTAVCFFFVVFFVRCKVVDKMERLPTACQATIRLYNISAHSKK